MEAQSSKRVFLGLGSNVESRVHFLSHAVKLLKGIGSVEKLSTVYESLPWGVKEQEKFLNCVLELRTYLDPFSLLERLKDIERNVGRKERFRWGPREIDIDILLYEDLLIDSRELSIPHPFLKDRDFVLIPLLEISPCIKDPRTGTYLSRALSTLSINLKPYCCLLQ